MAFEEEIGAVAVARIDHGAIHQRLIHPHRHRLRPQPLLPQQAASDQQAGSCKDTANDGSVGSAPWLTAPIQGQIATAG